MISRTQMILKKAAWATYNLSPREIVDRYWRRSSKSELDPQVVHRVMCELQGRFRRYQTSNLCGISSSEFAAAINSKIGTVDGRLEGYSECELDKQRDLSVRFHWGHDHDFGDFKLSGRMGDRHIALLANFAALFPISLDLFEDSDVFDIGCWTGGTTLILADLGSRVLAIEEVIKYADMTSFLVQCFGLDEQVTIEARSIYSCNSEQYADRFDIVYFPGVIYHLSDPLIALRILFNSLKVGGVILVESAGIPRAEPFCRFDGSKLTRDGDRKRMNRGGWNWFMPSPSALYRMMEEVGFREIQATWHHDSGRIFGYGKKVQQIGMCKAGLSVPNIR